jgi:hypothetical protein
LHSKNKAQPDNHNTCKFKTIIAFFALLDSQKFVADWKKKRTAAAAVTQQWPEMMNCIHRKIQSKLVYFSH